MQCDFFRVYSRYTATSFASSFSVTVILEQVNSLFSRQLLIAFWIIWDKRKIYTGFLVFIVESDKKLTNIWLKAITKAIKPIERKSKRHQRINNRELYNSPNLSYVNFQSSYKAISCLRYHISRAPFLWPCSWFEKASRQFETLYQELCKKHKFWQPGYAYDALGANHVEEWKSLSVVNEGTAETPPCTNGYS